MNDFYYLHPSSSQCNSSISTTESMAMIIREDVCVWHTEYLTLPSMLWIELTWQAWVWLFPVLRVVVDKHAFRHSQRGLINGWRVVHRQLQGVQKKLRVLLFSAVQLMEIPPSWVDLQRFASSVYWFWLLCGPYVLLDVVDISGTQTSLDLYMNAHIPSYVFWQYTEREHAHKSLSLWTVSIIS